MIPSTPSNGTFSGTRILSFFLGALLSATVLGPVLGVGAAANAQERAQAGARKQEGPARAGRPARNPRAGAREGEGGAVREHPGARASMARLGKLAEELMRADLPNDELTMVLASEIEALGRRVEAPARGIGRVPGSGSGAHRNQENGLGRSARALLRKGLRGRDLAEALRVEHRRRAEAEARAAATAGGQGEGRREGRRVERGGAGFGEGEGSAARGRGMHAAYGRLPRELVELVGRLRAEHAAGIDVVTRLARELRAMRLRRQGRAAGDAAGQGEGRSRREGAGRPGGEG